MAVLEGRLELSRGAIRFYPERLAESVGMDTPAQSDVAWVKDSDSHVCGQCSKPIVRGVFFSHKHHCRRYGPCKWHVLRHLVLWLSRRREHQPLAPPRPRLRV